MSDRKANDVLNFERFGRSDTERSESAKRMNILARVGWWCISKFTAPVTVTEYNIGQVVEVGGDRYLVRRILAPEPFYHIREPKIIIERIGGESGLQRRQMSERVLDLHREGKIGSPEE